MTPAPELQPLIQILYFSGLGLIVAVISTRLAAIESGPLAPLAEIRPQATFLAAFIVGVSFLLGDDAYAYAAICVFLAAAWPLGLYRRPALEPVLERAAGALRVATWNAAAGSFGGRLRGDAPLRDGAIRVLRDFNADLLVLQDATAADVDRVLARTDGYRALDKADGPGPALRILCRTDRPARLLSRSAPRLKRVRIDAPDAAPLIIFAAHAPAPWAADRGARFTVLIDALTRETRAGRRIALVGDLNAAPFGPVFARLTRDGGLRDPRRGRRPIATWPIPVFGPGLQIDHILVGPDVAVVDHQIGDMLRSDHSPIWADLHW